MPVTYVYNICIKIGSVMDSGWKRAGILDFRNKYVLLVLDNAKTQRCESSKFFYFLDCFGYLNFLAFSYGFSIILVI